MTNATQTLRIVVADDHPLVLTAISDYLTQAPGCTVVGTADSGARLLDLLRRTPCDLLVTDFSMQGEVEDEDGLRLIARLRRLYPGLPVVVFTMLTNGGILHELTALGVAGLVGKEEPITVLAEVCRRALVEPGTTLSARVAERLALDGANVDEFRRSNPLSPRELEVVRLFALGLNVTEISKRLNRSVTTVATQKRAAMRKLHLDSNADLIRYASEHGFA
ncbi:MULTISPECIES: response regulator transcription factor [Paraburkholderia]|uniref:LuxR family two component transcriptional regulator n=2 Tax=Burkholderiaceae TaxID=119060 RepID=A0A1A5WZZ6_9BURK|nr:MULTISPECIES: response regulator transcription factor [Paraburkholderia]MBB2980964.1 two-component system capsular synthesis response regulator RcsB [Paraburkholderia tropica]MBB3002217.1 two-component system capsular synthesis response regulator RcsB [Paraburkholderia tropica]MBB6321600.1 two-component system capsular synthesis response regulator RcsB [Paraburkholderia tropica]MDE1138714.1 response regulator transcription factor [Paraburkholderia tropica]OBR46649.1 DNA-binding response reg